MRGLQIGVTLEIVLKVKRCLKAIDDHLLRSYWPKQSAQAAFKSNEEYGTKCGPPGPALSKFND